MDAQKSFQARLSRPVTDCSGNLLRIGGSQVPKRLRLRPGT